MKRNKVSVIVPAYNSKATIERCLDSIVNQTYHNLEIIVVNDGSSDNTGEIIQELGQRDNRIKKIDISNSGVSHARNVGIDNATGDYITFVDSDDTIAPNMYEYLVGVADKYSADIAHCSYNNFSDAGLVSAVGDKGILLEQNAFEAIECLFLGKYFSGGLWNKLYSAKLFTNLRLDETISINEDVLMNFQLFARAEKIVFSDKPLYNYYSTLGSSTHTNSYLEKAKQSTRVSEKIFELSEGKPYFELSEKKLAVSYLLLFESMVCAHENNDIKSVKQRVRAFRKKNLYSRRAEKVKFFLLNCFPIIYRKMFWIYDRKRTFKLDPI